MKTQLKSKTTANNNYNICLIIFLGLFFLYNFFTGFASGGRWDLCQHIATADRFLAGKGFFYSSEYASSPYFPGVSFLSIIVSLIANPIRDYILLFLASIIGTFFIFQLLKITISFVEDKWLVLSATAVFLCYTLKHYQFYMCEFKPDTIILVIGIFLISISRKIISKKYIRTFYTWTFVCFLTFAMGLFKQHALYLDLGIGLYILFSREFSFKDTLFLLSAMISGGVIDIIVLFSIPNLPLNTMQNLKDMPYFFPKDIIFQIIDFAKKNLCLLSLITFSVFLIITKRIIISNELKQYLSMIVPFIVGQILGAYKIGGNDGNLEIAIITLLPFALISLSYITKTFNFYSNMTISFIILFYLFIMLLVIMLPTSGLDALKSYKNNQRIIKYLQKYEGETFMYYSNLYMPIVRSGIKVGMDMYSVPYHTMPYFYEEILNKKKYKYIIMENSDYFNYIDILQKKYSKIKTCANNTFHKNYDELVDSNMPKVLKGPLFVVNCGQ